MRAKRTASVNKGDHPDRYTYIIHILNYRCVSCNRMEINTNIYHKQLEKEECIICLDEVETEWRDLECHHRYHKKCIENWITIRAKCPMCMKNIKENKIVEINRNDNLIEETHYISIRRFIIFMCIIVCVIIVMVLSSS